MHLSKLVQSCFIKLKQMVGFFKLVFSSPSWRGFSACQSFATSPTAQIYLRNKETTSCFNYFWDENVILGVREILIVRSLGLCNSTSYTKSILKKLCKIIIACICGRLSLPVPNLALAWIYCPRNPLKALKTWQTLIRFSMITQVVRGTLMMTSKKTRKRQCRGQQVFYLIWFACLFFFLCVGFIYLQNSAQESFHK